MCMCVCMYVRTYVCVYLCMYVCMYVAMYGRFGKFTKSIQLIQKSPKNFSVT